MASVNNTISELPIVQELTGLQCLPLWKTTLGLARRHRRLSSCVGGWQTRLESLRPIKRPVFILGSPRSGTTFLGEMLNQLPGASYFYEPPILKYYARIIYERRMSIASARRLYSTVFHSLLWFAPGRGHRVVEKTPRHTWIAQQLLKMYPDASFAFIHRDGRDVALSLATKPWHREDAVESGKREPGGYLYGPFPHFYIEPERRDEYRHTTDFHRAIWIWRRYEEEMRRLESSLPSSCQVHFAYEEMIHRPTETVDRLLQFLGDDIPRDPLLRFASTAHAESIGRWKRDLGADEITLAEQEAGHLFQDSALAERYNA